MRQRGGHSVKSDAPRGAHLVVERDYWTVQPTVPLQLVLP